MSHHSSSKAVTKLSVVQISRSGLPCPSRPHQISPEQDRPMQVGFCKDRSVPVCPGQDHLSQDRFGKIGPGLADPEQVGLGQVHSVQVGSEEMLLLHKLA